MALAILLCSLRKRVCIEVRVGWTTALTSPAVNSIAGGGWGKGHWDLEGRFSAVKDVSLLILRRPSVNALSPLEVSWSEP